MRKLTIKECRDKVTQLIQDGSTIVVVRDNDNIGWSNGWVDFLMDNYNYSNLTAAFRVNLEMPKISAVPNPSK